MHTQTETINPTTLAPRFQQQKNVARMSTLEISELTGKQHKNVIRDVREMLDALEKDGSDLSHVSEDKDRRGYTTNFHLCRELTETLITGYSIPLRHKVIRRLHELEQQPQVPQTLPEALRLAADLADQNSSLRLVLLEQAPKVEALARIADAAGTMCMTDAAKHLNVPRKRLIDWMKEHRWIYRREGSARWLAYQPRQQAGLLDHKVTVIGLEENGDHRLASQVRITPKGLTVLAEKLEGGNHGR